MDGKDPLERLAIVAEQKEAREQKLLQQAEKQAKVMGWYYIGVAVAVVIGTVVVTSKFKKMQKANKASISQFLEYKP